MKIGILTQPLVANYGGILQNYAMQTIIKKMGHEPITVRLEHGYLNMKPIRFFVGLPKWVLRTMFDRLKGKDVTYPESLFKWRDRTQGIRVFVDEYITTTDYIDGRNLSMNFLNKYSIDMVVVGSDQVWHGGLPYMTNVYFCGFAENFDLPRISYAASFGFDEWRGNQKETHLIQSLLKRFIAVSVREQSGVELCKNYLNREDAEWVLDPTMLLTKDDYCQLCNDNPTINEPFLFAYVLDINDDKSKLIQRIATEKGLSVRYLDVTHTKKTDSINNWLLMFRDAKYVVTDSYHGTVFSLIFQKEFLCLYNKSRGNARMNTLKNLTGLNDRFLNSYEQLPEHMINYSIVDERIEKMRKKSFAFLETAIAKSSKTIQIA